MPDVATLRASLGWSQTKLAKCLGCDQSTIDRVEGGQPPSGPMALLVERLARLAEEHALAGMLVPDVRDLLVGRSDPPDAPEASCDPKPVLASA